jgi:SAM-dependent methyltransferase
MSTSSQTPTPENADRGELARQIREMGEWFHNLDLHGVPTAPNHFLGDFPNVKWKQICDAIPPRLDGATVLDIGCNAGFYSIELKRRGADYVLGVDIDERYLTQARFAAHTLDLDIDFRRCSVYELDSIPGQFDYVVFMGVFYHLRYPLLGRSHQLVDSEFLSRRSDFTKRWIEHPFSSRTRDVDLPAKIEQLERAICRGPGVCWRVNSRRRRSLSWWKR